MLAVAVKPLTHTIKPSLSLFAAALAFHNPLEQPAAAPVDDCRNAVTKSVVKYLFTFRAANDAFNARNVLRRSAARASSCL